MSDLPKVMMDNVRAVGKSALDLPLDSESEEAPAEPELNPGEELTMCPDCRCQRRAFTIIGGQCDSCRIRDSRVSQPAQIGWAEVRQRRNMLLTETDRAVLPDRSAELRATVIPLRSNLRDITLLAAPENAWNQLDEIQSVLNEITF